MKLQNIVATLLLIMVSQSVMAIKFEIANRNDHFDYIEVNPVWSGGPKEFARIGRKSNSKEYDSGAQVLKFIEWRVPSGACFRANVEPLLGKMSRNVVIGVYRNGDFSVDVKGGMRGAKVKAEPGKC